MPTLLCHSALRSAPPELRAALLRSSCRVSSHLSSPYMRALGQTGSFRSPSGSQSTSSEDISLNNESLVALRKDESDSSFQDERCFYRLCPNLGKHARPTLRHSGQAW
jgi:hypothetical protein